MSIEVGADTTVMNGAALRYRVGSWHEVSADTGGSDVEQHESLRMQVLLGWHLFLRLSRGYAARPEAWVRLRNHVPVWQRLHVRGEVNAPGANGGAGNPRRRSTWGLRHSDLQVWNNVVSAVPVVATCADADWSLGQVSGLRFRVRREASRDACRRQRLPRSRFGGIDDDICGRS